MWRQLSEASTPLDYPTNHQSFRNSWEDESACWITSRACWCLLFYSPSRVAPGWDPSAPSRHPLCAISRSRPHPSSDWHRQCSEAFLKAEGEQLQAQMVFLYIGLSVCLSVCPPPSVGSLHLIPALNISLHLSRRQRWEYNLLLAYREMEVGLACMRACRTRLC